jgi:hypothetical protein
MVTGLAWLIPAVPLVPRLDTVVVAVCVAARLRLLAVPIIQEVGLLTALLSLNVYLAIMVGNLYSLRIAVMLAGKEKIVHQALFAVETVDATQKTLSFATLTLQ